MIVDKELMNILFWYVDFVDDVTQGMAKGYPLTVTPRMLADLSFEVMTRLISAIDKYHETNEPDEALTYNKLLEMIVKIPSDLDR